VINPLNPQWIVIPIVAVLLTGCGSTVKGNPVSTDDHACTSAIAQVAEEITALPPACTLIPQQTLTEVLYANINHNEIPSRGHGVEARSCLWQGWIKLPTRGVYSPELSIQVHRRFRDPVLDADNTKSAVELAADYLDFHYRTIQTGFQDTTVPGAAKALTKTTEMNRYLVILVRNVTVEIRHADKTVSAEVSEQRLTAIATDLASRLSTMD
jgi:hypothetical protein